MDISSDEHDVLGESVGFRGVPERETNFDVHLEEDSADGGKAFLESVGEDTLGWDSELVQTALLDVVVDPSGLVVEESDYDLASIGNLTCEGIGEVVGSVAFDFNTSGFLETDAEGLSALLEHSHKIFGLVEVVVHEDPVFERSGMFDLLLDVSEVVSVLDGNFFSVDFDHEVLESVSFDSHGLFEGNVVLVLSEDTLDLLGVVVDSGESGLGVEFGVLGELLLESGIVLLFVEESGEFAEFGDQIEGLDLLVLFSAHLSLVDEEGLTGVLDLEVVSLLVVVKERDGLVVDLDVVLGGLSEVDVGDLVNSEVAVVSNDGFADKFVFDFAIFPAFFTEVIDVLEDGVLLEASGDEVDLQEETFLVEVNGGEETLNDGDVGLFDLASLVLHHVVELRVSADFNHVEFSVGVFNHNFEKLLNGKVFV